MKIIIAAALALLVMVSCGDLALKATVEALTIPEWSPSREYSTGERSTAGMRIYASLADHNIGNEPWLSPAWWRNE